MIKLSNLCLNSYTRDNILALEDANGEYRLVHSSPVMALNVYSHLIAESVEPVFLEDDALVTGAGGKLVHLPAREGKRAK